MKRIASIKALSVMVAVSVISLSLSACGKPAAGNNAQPTVSETAQSTVTPQAQQSNMSGTIKFLFPGDEPAGQQEVNEAISQKCKEDGLDFTFEYTFVPWDNYWNKQGMAVAADEEYDITWDHISNYAGHVSKKLLTPMDDALNKYGKDILSSTPQYSWKEMTYNNSIYAIPRVVPTATTRAFIIRGDLREKYGLPEIKTPEDYIKYCEAIQKNEPGMVPTISSPMRYKYTTDKLWLFFGLWECAPVYLDVNDWKFKSFYETDDFKKLVDDNVALQAKGLLPNQNLNIDDAFGSFFGGKIGSMEATLLRLSEQVDAFKAQQPNGKMEFVQIYPDQPKYIISACDNLLAVLATSKKVNESVAFINWTRKSQENYDLFSYGIKDVNYKLDGNSVITADIPQEHSYPAINWAWTDLRFHRFSKECTPEYLDMVKNWDKDAVQIPALGISWNMDLIKAEMTQLNAVFLEYNNVVKNGYMEYDKFAPQLIQKCKDAGLDKVISELQKQLDAYLANNK